MTKQSFPIPEGCKAVTVEHVGNQIITTFDPVFKRGDVLIGKNSVSTSISIFDRTEIGKYFYFAGFFNNEFCNSLLFNDFINYNAVDSIRHATPEEAQLLWDALAKKGKRWNPETMQVEEIKKKRWRAEQGKVYYYINPSLRTANGYDAHHGIDDIMHEKGNHFKTEEQAQRAANRLQAELDKFWEEELK